MGGKRRAERERARSGAAVAEMAAAARHSERGLVAHCNSAFLVGPTCQKENEHQLFQSDDDGATAASLVPYSSTNS